MSYKLVDQIHRTEMPGLTGVEKHVLAYMATHADEDGSGVFCGRNTISTMTNLGVRTVDRAIGELRRKGYLAEAGWMRRKRRFDICLTGASPSDDLSHDDLRPAGDTCRTGVSTSANLTPDICLSDVLSSKGSGPLSDPLTLSVCGTSAHGAVSDVGDVKNAAIAATLAGEPEEEVCNALQTSAVDFTDHDDEDAGDPPMVVRRITAADIEELERAKLRRLDTCVLEAVAARAVNGDDGDG
jgi:hypothetical protein